MGLLDKANRILSAQNNLKQLFINAFSAKGVNATNKTLKEMPDLIAQIQGEGGGDVPCCNVIISETEPTNAPEGTIWIIPTGLDASDSSSSSTAPEEPSDSSSSSSSSSSSTGTDTAAAINVSGFAAASYPRLDGEYTYDSANDYYVNSESYKIKWVTPDSSYNYKPSTAQWCIVDSDTAIAHLGGTQNDINSIAGTRNIEITVDVGYSPSVTITVNGGSSGGSSSSEESDSGESDSGESGSGDASALSIDFTDNSGFYGSYTDMLAGDYAYDSSLDAYRNAGNSTAFGVVKWFDSPPSWGNGNDNGGSGAGWYLCSYNSDNTVKDMFYNLKGTSGDINSITAGDYTGNYTMFADSSYKFSFTISLSGVTSGGGSSSDSLTVSGAPESRFNGTYNVYTGSSVTSYKHDKNETYLIYVPASNTWAFTDANPDIAVNEFPMWVYHATDGGNNSPIGITVWNDASGMPVNILTARSEGDLSESTTTTCWECGQTFSYDPEGPTPTCPHCGMLQ